MCEHYFFNKIMLTQGVALLVEKLIERTYAVLSCCFSNKHALIT